MIGDWQEADLPWATVHSSRRWIRPAVGFRSDRPCVRGSCTLRTCTARPARTRTPTQTVMASHSELQKFTRHQFLSAFRSTETDDVWISADIGNRSQGTSMLSCLLIARNNRAEQGRPQNFLQGCAKPGTIAPVFFCRVDAMLYTRSHCNWEGGF